MKVLGIDYGGKRIGLSIGDTSVGIAHPRGVIESGADAVKRIVRLISDEGIEMVVLGLPLSLNGGESGQTEETRRFAELLKEATGIEVNFQDERLSSRGADRILSAMGKSGREKRDIADAHQAAIILQTYLDSLGED